MGAQVDDLQQRGRVAIGRAVQRYLVHLRTRRRVIQRFQHWLDAGQAQADQPAFLPALCGGLGEVFLVRFAEARYLGFVGQQHRRIFGGGLQLRAEGGGQLGQLRVDVAQALPLVVV